MQAMAMMSPPITTTPSPSLKSINSSSLNGSISNGGGVGSGGGGGSLSSSSSISSNSTLPVAVAASKVVDELKKVKRGLTIEDIEKRTNFIVNAGLRDLLSKNQHLEYNDKTQRFVYKFKYCIENKNDILEYLKESPLVIGEEVEGSYDTIAEDILELKDTHAVLSVQHQTKKKEVLYLQHYRQPKEIPWEMPPEIRELWKKVPSIDVVDLKKYLEKNRIKLAQLDTNVVPEELRRNNQKNDNDKKRSRKRGANPTVKSNISSDLAALAHTLIVTNRLFGDDAGSIKIGPVDEDIDDKKQTLLHHNVDANRQEFELVSDLIRMVGHWFYEDQHVVALDAFLKQKFHKDTDLGKALLLPQKQVGGILVKLHSHQLLSKRICEQGNRQFNVYEMDLDKFTNICNYRVLKMQDLLKDEIDELGSSIFQCDNCKKRYKALDLPTLYDSGKSLHCNNGYCNNALSPIDNSEKIEKEKLLEKVKKEIAPLLDKLMKLTNSKESKTPGKPSIRKPIQKAKSARLGEKIKPVLPAVNTTGNTRENDFDIAPDPEMDFDPSSLYFSMNYEVFVPICHKWDDYKDNISLRLAKYLLDEIGEFQHIVNATVYIYKITEHSLYLGWCRGYAPEEVVRLLKLLGRNPLPFNMERLVRENVNNNKYYKATMTLRNRHYCVQAENKEVLEMLMKNNNVRDLVPIATSLQEVTTSCGKVTYHFPINPGQSEAMKKVCRELKVTLIDEFDFVGISSLPSVKIDMKASTKVRSYQEFAVSRLFWNDFKCHSGILVLPCGAGKTLIGINVVAALKKPCIIFCQSTLAVTQWKEQMVRWTTIPENSVSRFSSNHPLEWNPNADVIITTYGMFSATSNNRSGDSKHMMNSIKEREWGLMVLDEVHLVPAKIFRKVTNQILSHIKLGLTATMIREDELINDLPHLVGPKLFELDIFPLRMHNYISPVQCVELHCPMTDTFSRAYTAAKSLEEQRMLYSTNPNKTRVVWGLITQHIEKKHRIMVFCDNLFCLHFYTEMLHRPKIDGSTHQDERVRILRNFRDSENGDCVLFSQVGDQSIDLPEADVVIQVALMHSGRMQEGQRIGRIQRPQQGKVTAYFYSLVSDATREADFAKKRRIFLQEHGYTIIREKNRAYEKFLTEDTAHVVSEATQQSIIAAVQNDLNNKENERVHGKAQPQAQSLKRKKPNDSEKELKRKMKHSKLH